MSPQTGYLGSSKQSMWSVPLLGRRRGALTGIVSLGSRLTLMAI
jgi:hypothetical protein